MPSNIFIKRVNFVDLFRSFGISALAHTFGRTLEKTTATLNRSGVCFGVCAGI
jgi:hypothetical protein